MNGFVEAFDTVASWNLVFCLLLSLAVSIKKMPVYNKPKFHKVLLQHKIKETRKFCLINRSSPWEFLLHWGTGAQKTAKNFVWKNLFVTIDKKQSGCQTAPQDFPVIKSTVPRSFKAKNSQLTSSPSYFLGT